MYLNFAQSSLSRVAKSFWSPRIISLALWWFQELGSALAKRLSIKPCHVAGYKPGNISSMWLQDFIRQFCPEIPSNLLGPPGARRISVDLSTCLASFWEQVYQILMYALLEYLWKLVHKCRIMWCTVAYMSRLVRDECPLPLLLWRISATLS